MSQTLILELSDEVYTTIQRQAESAGTSPAHWLATTLEQQYSPQHAGKAHCSPVPQPSSTPHGSALSSTSVRSTSRRHRGGNEQIDADLAREYSDTHEAP